MLAWPTLALLAAPHMLALAVASLAATAPPSSSCLWASDAVRRAATLRSELQLPALRACVLHEHPAVLLVRGLLSG